FLHGVGEQANVEMRLVELRGGQGPEHLERGLRYRGRCRRRDRKLGGSVLHGPGCGCFFLLRLRDGLSGRGRLDLSASRRGWLFSLGHGGTVARPVLGNGLRARGAPVYEEGAKAKTKPQEAQTVGGEKHR